MGEFISNDRSSTDLHAKHDVATTAIYVTDAADSNADNGDDDRNAKRYQKQQKQINSENFLI